MLDAVQRRAQGGSANGGAVLGKQIARHRVMVGSRWQWVANGGAVLLGNTAFCNGCKWWPRPIGECRLLEASRWQLGCTPRYWGMQLR